MKHLKGIDAMLGRLTMQHRIALIVLAVMIGCGEDSPIAPDDVFVPPPDPEPIGGIDEDEDDDDDNGDGDGNGNGNGNGDDDGNGNGNDDPDVCITHLGSTFERICDYCSMYAEEQSDNYGVYEAAAGWRNACWDGVHLIEAKFALYEEGASEPTPQDNSLAEGGPDMLPYVPRRLILDENVTRDAETWTFEARLHERSEGNHTMKYEWIYCQIDDFHAGNNECPDDPPNP